MSNQQSLVADPEASDNACWDFCNCCPPAIETIDHAPGSAVTNEGNWVKVSARRVWSPRAQTASVDGRFDAAITAGRHTWPTLSFPDNTIQAVALMRMLLTFDQRSRCAGCGIRADRLLLDHCHVTHLVRGALCHRCNTLEATGPIEFLRDYRRRPPAFWLGWVVPHSHDHPQPDVGAVTTAVLQARHSGASEHHIEAAWGSAWLQANHPAAAEALTPQRPLDWHSDPYWRAH